MDATSSEIRTDARRCERRAVTAATILGRKPVARTGDLCDPPVPELEQMAHRRWRQR
jgi:hypothetical protein